ncbi:MAG: hypothetical protein CMF22_11965 [Idiomarinaceae bacterium]|nr:hypothetical protein [Idiomarinaceae bacterium]|tara:strand:+ start:19232 stop:20548 length:1317 start_codon:yes stop_codon:yes gene_type:complete
MITRADNGEKTITLTTEVLSAQNGIAKDVYQSVVTPEARRYLISTGFDIVCVGIGGDLLALCAEPSSHLFRTVDRPERGDSIKCVDIKPDMRVHPLGARIACWGSDIPELARVSVLRLDSMVVEFYHQGKNPTSCIIKNESHEYIQHPKEKRVNYMKYAKGTGRRYINADAEVSTSVELARMLFGDIEDHVDCGELFSDGYEYIFINGYGFYEAAKDINMVSAGGSEYSIGSPSPAEDRVQLGVAVDIADASIPREFRRVMYDTSLKCVGIVDNSPSLQVRHTIRHDELEEPIKSESIEEAANPKDIIGSSKIPMSIWPSAATAYGSVGLYNGALKYGKANFRASNVRTSIYVDAAMRHMMAYMEGEEVDPDDGVPHLAAALASLAIIVDAKTAGTLIDDRQVEAEGYRDMINEMTGHIKRLQELHADRNPKHHTRDA